MQFSDSLVYTSRGMTPSNQFKVHGQLPLYGMTVCTHRVGGWQVLGKCLFHDDVHVLLQIRESEEEWGVPHSFTLYGKHQSVVVAARYTLIHAF